LRNGDGRCGWPVRLHGAGAERFIVSGDRCRLAETARTRLLANLPDDPDPQTYIRGNGSLLYGLLVQQTGYSLDRFEQWTARTLAAALLKPDSG